MCVQIDVAQYLLNQIQIHWRQCPELVISNEPQKMSHFDTSNQMRFSSPEKQSVCVLICFVSFHICFGQSRSARCRHCFDSGIYHVGLFLWPAAIVMTNIELFSIHRHIYIFIWFVLNGKQTKQQPKKAHSLFPTQWDSAGVLAILKFLWNARPHTNVNESRVGRKKMRLPFRCSAASRLCVVTTPTVAMHVHTTQTAYTHTNVQTTYLRCSYAVRCGVRFIIRLWCAIFS